MGVIKERNVVLKLLFDFVAKVWGSFPPLQAPKEAAGALVFGEYYIFMYF